MEQATQQIAQKPPFPIKTKIAAWWMIVFSIILTIIFLLFLITPIGMVLFLLFIRSWDPKLSFLLIYILITFLLLFTGLSLLKRKKWVWVFSVFLLSIICYFCIKILLPIDFLFLLFLIWNLVLLFFLLLDRKNFWKIAS